MLDDVLRQAFQLAHGRFRWVLLDLLWKAIWLALTLVALFLVAAWFGAQLSSLGWMDTGNRAINSAVAFALFRQFGSAHRGEVFAAIAAVLLFSLLMWFVLEAAFRARILAITGFSVLLLSNVLRCLVVSSTALMLGTICFGRYLVTPIAEWPQLWPDTRGAAFIAVLTVAALAFLVTIVDTLIRIDAIELLGTDLIRVTGLVGMLLSFEVMVSGSCIVMVGVAFLNVAGWRDAVVLLGTAAVAIVFVNVLHSYLLLVRFFAVDIMRQDGVDV